MLSIFDPSVSCSRNLAGGFDCRRRCFFEAGGERSQSSQTKFSSRSDSELSNSSKWRLFLNFAMAFRHRTESRDQQREVHGAVTNLTMLLCDRSVISDVTCWRSKQGCWLVDGAWSWGLLCFLEGGRTNHASTGFVLQTCPQNEDTNSGKEILIFQSRRQLCRA